MSNAADSLDVVTQEVDIRCCLQPVNRDFEPSQLTECVDCTEQKLGKAFFARQGIEFLAAKFLEFVIIDVIVVKHTL